MNTQRVARETISVAQEVTTAGSCEPARSTGPAKLSIFVGFLLMSTLLHAAVLVCAFRTTASLPTHEAPRLGPTSVSVRLLPAAGSVMTATPSAQLQASGPTVSTEVTSEPSARDPQRASQPDKWLPSGRLTRLPVPLDAVDLDQPDMHLTGFAGRIELILLIDRHGRVAHVRTASGEPAAQAFAEQAAGRFRSARFTPGEVDGVAVNAILKISVVSERIGGT